MDKPRDVGVVVVTMADLLDAASGLTGIESRIIVGASQRRQVAEVRRDIALAALQTGLSTTEIGRGLNRDHSSIIHATKGRMASEFSGKIALAASAVAQRRVADFISTLAREATK